MSDPYADSDNYSDVWTNETSIEQELTIPDTFGGERLDVALAQLLPEYSRSRLTGWIKNGQVLVDGKSCQPKIRLRGGETLLVTPSLSDEMQAFQPEPIDIQVVYQDSALVVIDKPAGLVVHPAAGNWHGTLLNGLLYHFPELSQIPRAGIVHRLDKDTSGLMVVARTVPAQTELVRQLQARSVKRIYRAIVDGQLAYDGKIDANIGRDPHNRLRMAVVAFGGKPAVTHIRVLERFLQHSYIECRLETGRTHQIRVHLQSARHPLAGDPVYGNPRHRMNPDVADMVAMLGRQALHAYSLTLEHPVTHEQMEWNSPLPDDIKSLLAALKHEMQPDLPEPDDEDDDDNDEVEVVYVRE